MLETYLSCEGDVLMLRSTFLLLVVFAPLSIPAFALAELPGVGIASPHASRPSASAGGVDLNLGEDNRLAVHVATGQEVIFWDRSGQPLEIKESGRVAIRPGTYSVQSGTQVTLCRVWAQGTAPPAAVDTLPIVRGQNGNPLLWRLDSITPQVIVISGIGLGIWSATRSSGS